MAELEKLGLPGPTQLRELLNTCEDPAEAILTFQNENGIQVHSLKPALKLLDLHGNRRIEFHEMVLNDLQERLVTRIKSLGNNTDKKSLKLIENLLHQSFPLVKVPQIRPIVLETLRKLPKIPVKILEAVRNEPELYKECAVEVRQKLWLQNEQLFCSEILPIFRSYLKDKSTILRNVETLSPAYFLQAPKFRRQSVHVQKIVSMLGEYATLYDKLLQYIRKEFLESKNAHYCSLRFELLMALHDGDVKPLTDIDPCHNFAWCLDPCIRDKHLDPKHAGELKTFLDSMKRQSQEVWGDVAMISGDPHVMHFFGSLAVKVLKQSLAHETLPRDQGSMQLVLRLLSLGSAAWNMQKEGIYKEPKPDSIIFTKFLPNVMTLMAEDNARLEIDKFPINPESIADCDQRSIKSESWNSKVPKSVIDFLKTEPLAVWIWLYLVVDMSGKKKGDALGLSRAVSQLPVVCDKVGYDETFLHLVLSKLINLGIRKSTGADMDQFCKVVFEKFLLKGLSIEHVKWHILRVLYHLGGKMAENEVESLMSKLEEKSKEDITDEAEGSLSETEADEMGAIMAKVQQRIAVARAEEANKSQMDEDVKKEECKMETGLDFDIPIPTPAPL